MISFRLGMAFLAYSEAAAGDVATLTGSETMSPVFRIVCRLYAAFFTLP